MSLQDTTGLVDRIHQENQASQSFNFGSSPQDVLFPCRAQPHLASAGEGFTTAFKRSMPSDPGRGICAFSNATGGAVLIGVDDAGTVINVRDHNRLKSRIQS